MVLLKEKDKAEYWTVHQSQSCPKCRSMEQWNVTTVVKQEFCLSRVKWVFIGLVWHWRGNRKVGHFYYLWRSCWPINYSVHVISWFQNNSHFCTWYFQTVHCFCSMFFSSLHFSTFRFLWAATIPLVNINLIHPKEQWLLSKCWKLYLFFQFLISYVVKLYLNYYWNVQVASLEM